MVSILLFKVNLIVRLPMSTLAGIEVTLMSCISVFFSRHQLETKSSIDAILK